MGDKKEHEVTKATEVLAPWGYSVAAFVRGKVSSMRIMNHHGRLRECSTVPVHR
jgi:hypothetical protein